MSEFYSFFGIYIRRAGNSPTEFSVIDLTVHAPGKRANFSYQIDTPVTGELPFVTLDDRFLDTFVDFFGGLQPVLGSAGPGDRDFEARLGQVDWGGGFSTTILALDEQIGLITNRYVFALDGDPIPLLGPTSALEYNAFIRSASFGTASSEFAPGARISLKDLDQARNEDPAGVTLFGRLGQDSTLEGSLGADRLLGSTGNDTIFGFASGDTLQGGAGDDVMDGGRGDDEIDGNSGADVLSGDVGNDRIRGGGGKDSIEGGAGRDVLVGGRGADVFVFSSGDGKDRIKDFDTSNRGDSIDLSDVRAIRNFSDLTGNHMSEVNGDVVIEDGAGLRIVLNNTALSDLDAGDFIF